MTKNYRKLSELKNWDKNPRNINKDDFARLKKHITEHGQMQPLVITQDGEVLGGNMRLRAYKDLGITDVWVEVVEPRDEADKLRIALVLNDRAGYYDSDLLANLIPNYPEFNWEDYAVDLKEPQTLQSLIESLTPVEEDEVPEVAEGEADSKLGEVYHLGRHRLICGDATKIEDVEKLMDGKKADMVFTDPPYGVEIGEKNRFLNSFQPSGRNLQDIVNDNLSKDELFQMLTKAFTNANTFGQDHCSYYVTAPQGGELGLMMMMMMMMNAGLPVRHILIWIKDRQNFSLGRLDYEYKHEPILYTWKKNHKFYGQDCSVWEIDKPISSKLHPTMKPVELVARALKNSSKRDDLVLDLFGGSGSTLIACEQTNRICYMMEIDPKYCDVIRKRFDNFVNKK